MSVADLGDGRVVVEAVGEIDVLTASVFENAVAAEPVPGTTALVLDLSEVTFCSTSGISELIKIHTRATAAGVRLLLVLGTRVMRRALEVMGLLDMFSTYPTRAAALNAAVITG